MEKFDGSNPSCLKSRLILCCIINANKQFNQLKINKLIFTLSLMNPGLTG